MALSRYHWRDFGAVGTLRFMAPLLEAPGVTPGDLFALTYQFNVLLMPTLAPVCLCLWLWQLQGPPLWEALANDIRRASSRA